MECSLTSMVKIARALGVRVSDLVRAAPLAEAPAVPVR